MLKWLAWLSLGNQTQTNRFPEPNKIKADGNSCESDCLSTIVREIKAAKEIVVFTGAGISAESGIPTFRDGATGLWNKIDPEEVASICALEANPGPVWGWLAQLKKMVDECKPNPGHVSIAELGRHLTDKRFTLITQNIDGYHQQAGSDRVFELHGSIHRLRCHRNCSHYETWQNPATHPESCPNCGAMIRPDVVLFGEPLNEDLFSFAEEAALNADVFFSVGTSSSVRPASGLPILAKLVGALVVEVNPHETSFSQQADYSIRSSAGQFFPELLVRYQEEG